MGQSMCQLSVWHSIPKAVMGVDNVEGGGIDGGQGSQATTAWAGDVKHAQGKLLGCEV